MKKTLLMLLILIFVIKPLSVSAVSVSAKAAAVINGDTGELIYSLNSEKKLPMASTTKIMTALLLCEQGTPEREVTVTKQMVAVEGSSMGLLEGDTVSFRSLLYGMLLASGNDAANTAAIAIDGSVDAFVERMNNKARELGLSNTHFVTPSGLDAEEHYTTAYELALLARYALSNEEFAAAAASEYETLYYGNPPYRRTLKNHNRLLSSYEGLIGVKTGFTKKSGRCLVTAAKRDGEFVIAVTLNAPDDWNDHKQLLDYGFERIERTVLSSPRQYMLPVADSGVAPLKVSYGEIAVAMHEVNGIEQKTLLPRFVYGSIEKGEKLGKVGFYKNGSLIAESNITAQNSYIEPEFDFWLCVKDIFFKILSCV